MNKNKLLFLFLLHCMIGFSQTEYFDPLDELVSGYGTRDILPIKNHEINFPSPSEDEQPVNNSTKVNKKNFDFNAYKNAHKNNIRAQLKSQQDNNAYAPIYSFDATNLNFERFKNSPCFSEIGFHPSVDITSLEKSYSDCERQKNIIIVKNALFILAFAVIIGIVLYFGRKKPTDKKPTDEKTVKPTDKKVKFIDKAITLRGTINKTGRAIKKYEWKYALIGALIGSGITGAYMRNSNDPIPPTPPKIEKKPAKKKPAKEKLTKKKPANKSIPEEEKIRMEIDSLTRGINIVDDYPNV